MITFLIIYLCAIIIFLLLLSCEECFGNLEFDLFFAWYDMWVGIYYDRHDNVVYVVPFPMFVIRIQLYGE